MERFKQRIFPGHWVLLTLFGGSNVKKEKTIEGVAVVGGGLTKLGLFKERNSKDFFAEAYIGTVLKL